MDDRAAGGGAGIRQLTFFGPAPSSRRPDGLTHVLLDLDGCLLDSREPILRSINGALRTVGLSTITALDLEPMIGPPLQEAVADILAERQADPGLVAPIVAAYRDRYRTLAVELAATVPGMDEVVADLAGRFTLGIVTAKPVAFSEPILETLRLRDLFAVVAGPDLASPEPKRETLARALTELDVPADGSVMVGDRRHDVAAARAHGVVAVGVTWGHGTADELHSAGADHIVDDPAELPAVIDRLAGPGR